MVAVRPAAELSIEDAADRLAAGTPEPELGTWYSEDDYYDDDQEEMWRSLVPLGHHGKLPGFPVEALPPALRNYVTEVAAARQVSVDMPAMLALAVVAASGARRFDVEIRGAQVEPLNLWAIVGAAPGERKSAVFRDLVFPLHEMEKELAEEGKEARALAQEHFQVNEAQKKSLRGKLARATDEETREKLEQELAELVRGSTELPSVPRLTADDVTPERLASLMAQNEGCMAIMSPEGGVFGMMAGRYREKGGPNLDVYLKGHSGDALMVDRADGRQDRILHPALTMGLAVQPEVIQNLHKDQAMRYLGLTARGLYSLPESLAGTRFHQARTVNKKAYSDYREAIRRILETPVRSEEEGVPGRHRLQIVEEARKVHWRGADRVELSVGPEGHLSGIISWAGKLAGQTARIAGNFHLIAEPGEPHKHLGVAAAQVEAAWLVAEYLEAHALASFALMDELPERRLAGKILSWIERCHAAEFSRSECYQAVRRTSGVTKPTDMVPALELLMLHNYIAQQPEQICSGAGRPRSVTYSVNREAVAT